MQALPKLSIILLSTVALVSALPRPQSVGAPGRGDQANVAVAARFVFDPSWSGPEGKQAAALLQAQAQAQGQAHVEARDTEKAHEDSLWTRTTEKRGPTAGSGDGDGADWAKRSTPAARVDPMRNSVEERSSRQRVPVGSMPTGTGPPVRAFPWGGNGYGGSWGRRDA
ncbi:hypothetical protein OC834_006644 [Tilletia horrida]|nr:hypothetical protein OC834_006644 [Tilletia horrida]